MELDHDWVIYLLLTVLSFGVWMFLPKIVVRTISNESAIIFEILGGVAFGVVVLGFVHLDFHIVGTVCSLIAGFCSYVGAYYYIKTVKMNPVGLTVSIASLYPVVTVILSISVLQERASPKRIAGIILALVAIYLISLPKMEGKQPGS
jgi:transporter family protein